MTVKGQEITLPGVKASSDLSAKQYHVVKFSSTAGEVKVSSSVKDVHIGLLQNDPESGQAAEVAVSGISKGIVEGAITRGDNLSANTTGELMTETFATRPIVGRAAEAATAQGDLIQVILSPREL